MTINRREFVVGALAGASAFGAIKQPHWNFPASPRDRLAVASYPFRSFFAKTHSPGAADAHGMNLQQFAQTLTSKFGVRGIEPWGPHFVSVETAYIHELRQSFDKAGLHVVDVPVDIEVNLCGTASDRRAGLSAYYKWVDAAVLLNSPSIRIHLPHSDTSDSFHCAVGSLKELAVYGEGKGIVINIENDDPHTEQPDRIVRVLKAVNSPYLRSLPDFCNSMLISNNQKANEQALSTLFPLAYNISHVKDSEQDNGKVYRVDVDRIFSIAKHSGYRGYFSMEFEGEGDPYEGTRKLLEASLRNLSS